MIASRACPPSLTGSWPRRPATPTSQRLGPLQGTPDARSITLIRIGPRGAAGERSLLLRPVRCPCAWYTSRHFQVCFCSDSVAKLPKCRATNFPRKDETSDNRRSNAASNPLPESPVSLTHGGVVPHIIIRSSRLRLGEFESHAAKRLLQHYRSISRHSSVRLQCPKCARSGCSDPK